jgi:hypothetical protein
LHLRPVAPKDMFSRMAPDDEPQMTEIQLAAKFVPGERASYPERFCPNCSMELRENRCKLSCAQCGFYLSCSDFY